MPSAQHKLTHQASPNGRLRKAFMAPADDNGTVQFPYYLVALYEQITGYLADFDNTEDTQRLLLGLDVLLGGLQRLARDENIFDGLLPHVVTLQDSTDASMNDAELSTADFLKVEGELLERIGMALSARESLLDEVQKRVDDGGMAGDGRPSTEQIAALHEVIETLISTIEKETSEHVRIVIEIGRDGVVTVRITQEEIDQEKRDRLLRYLKRGGYIVGGIAIGVLDVAIHVGSHGFAHQVAAKSYDIGVAIATHDLR
jgi:hypothetical protein